MTQSHIPLSSRAEIRKKIRKSRQSLSASCQNEAEKNLMINFIQHISLPKNARIGVYLSNDGELGTEQLIQKLRESKHQVYLPVIHPFNGATLLFQLYEKNSPMKSNRYGILEPQLNCSHICPLYELDYLLMPLVAFDAQGNRLGMGGGYYDKTLTNYYAQGHQKPVLLGLAHDCQKVPLLPIEAWDVPLQKILTPSQFYQW